MEDNNSVIVLEMTMMTLTHLTFILTVLISQASCYVNTGCTGSTGNHEAIVVKLCENMRKFLFRRLPNGNYKLTIKCNGDFSYFKTAPLQQFQCVETDRDYTPNEIHAEVKSLGSSAPDMRSFLIKLFTTAT